MGQTCRIEDQHIFRRKTRKMWTGRRSSRWCRRCNLITDVLSNKSAIWQWSSSIPEMRTSRRMSQKQQATLPSRLLDISHHQVLCSDCRLCSQVLELMKVSGYLEHQEAVMSHRDVFWVLDCLQYLEYDASCHLDAGLVASPQTACNEGLSGSSGQ